MLTRQLKEEELSYVYVHAIAAMAGFSCEKVSVDMDGIDIIIRAKGKLSDDSVLLSPSLELQLKATINWKMDKEKLSYRLRAKNYHKLIGRTAIHRLLVLLCLPKDENDWIEQDEDKLILKKCAYWINLRGLPAIEQETITIKIPRKNIFSPEMLSYLMRLVAEQKDLP